MTTTRPPAVVDLRALVGHWVEAGLVTPEQAGLLLADAGEQADTDHPRGPVSGLLVEAFAYLGGVVVLVAATVLADRYWDEVARPLRLGLLALCAVLLLAAGAAVPQRLADAGARLGSVLWLLSTAASCLLLVSAAGERQGWSGDDVALVASAGTAGYAWALWRRRPALLQHVVLFAAVLSTAAGLAAHVDGGGGSAVGVAVWGAAVCWSLLAWGGLLGPRAAGYALAAAGAVAGTVPTSEHDWGLLLGGLTVALVVAAAVLRADLVLLAVGAVGALVVLPVLVGRFLPGGVAAPLLLLVVGVALLAVAVRLSRRTVPRGPYAGRVRLPAATLLRAVGAAGVVALLSAAAVLALG